MNLQKLQIFIWLFVLFFSACEIEDLERVNAPTIEIISANVSFDKLQVSARVFNIDENFPVSISNPKIKVRLLPDDSLILLNPIIEEKNDGSLIFFAEETTFPLDKTLEIQACADINKEGLNPDTIIAILSESLKTGNLEAIGTINRNGLNITLNVGIAGLEENTEIDNLGYQWIKTEEREDLEDVFGNYPLSNFTFNEEIDLNEPFFVDTSFEMNCGIYYYFRPYLVYQGNLIPGEVEELLGSDCWTRISDFAGDTPPPLYEAIGFAIGYRGYIGTGRVNNNGPVTNEFWEYNPDDNSWGKIDPLPGLARREAVAFVVNGTAYIGLGYKDVSPLPNPLNDFYSFNTSTGWNSSPFNSPFPQAIASAVPLVFEDGTNEPLVLLGTGRKLGLENSSEFYQLDWTSNSWILRSEYEYPINAFDGIGFTIGNEGVVLSGTETSTSFMIRPDIPNTSWDESPFEVPRSVFSGSLGFSVNGKGYQVFGYRTVLKVNSTVILEYHPDEPITDRWVEKTNSDEGRYRAAGFVVKNKIYVYGGKIRKEMNIDDDEVSSDLFIYTPDL